MRVIPTETPVAKLCEDRVIAQIQSGPTTLEISLSLHEALALAANLHCEATRPIQAARVAKLLQFPERRRAS